MRAKKFDIDAFINRIDAFLAEPTTSTLHHLLTDKHMFGHLKIPGYVSKYRMLHDCQFHHHVIGGQHDYFDRCGKCPFGIGRPDIFNNNKLYYDCEVKGRMRCCYDSISPEVLGLVAVLLEDFVPLAIPGFMQVRALCEIEKERRERERQSHTSLSI